MRKIEKVLIERKTGQMHLIKDLNEDFHTGSDVISKEELSKTAAGSNQGKEIAISNKGKEHLVIDPQFSDLWNSLQRGPQIMIQKDIGLILAKTGVNKDSVVVDAGGGSGSLCLSLANVCKEVIVYEINPEHLGILSRNISLFNFKNVHLKQENIYNGISESEVDAITLDLPEPWKVTEHAEQALNWGGWLVVYLPNLHQVQKFIDSTSETNITVLETLELIERKWKIDDKIMRPEFEMLGHTGFLIFCRKI